MPDDTPESSRLILAAMAAAGMPSDPRDGALALAAAVAKVAPKLPGVSQDSAASWMAGKGVPFRVILALVHVLPGLDKAALMGALAYQAAKARDALPPAPVGGW